MKNWKFAISNPLKDEEAPSRCKGRGGKLLLWREGTCLKRTMLGSRHRRCYMLRNNFNHLKCKTLRGSRWQTTQKRRLLLFFSRRVSQNFARGRLGNGLAFCFISRRFWFSSHGNGDSLVAVNCICDHINLCLIFQAFRSTSDSAVYRGRACTQSSTGFVVTFVSIWSKYHRNLQKIGEC